MSDVNKVNTNGPYSQIRNILNPFSANNQSTSQTDISPLQSITRLRHHHSSCTVCLRVQYWGPFSSSCTLHLSPTSQLYNHSVNHPLFVDDTQLQKSAPLSEVTNVIKERNACTDDINTWITENQLRLNDDKTKGLLFPFSSSLKPSTVSFPDSITLGSHNIAFSDSARNLGVILDSKLSMKKHVTKSAKLFISSLNTLVQPAGFSLKTQPRHLLLPTSSHGLATATVSSWVHLIPSSSLSRKLKTLLQDSFS